MSEVRLVSSMEGPDGAPVLILANPIGTTRAIWDAQARVLREDHRLLRFELRGHGTPGAQSDAPPGPYSIAELGTDVLSLMREHGVATAAYCGISIGGMTGLWLAANAPERISSLVVCCAAITPMPSRQSWLDRAALVRSGGMAAISETVPPRWFTPDFIARQPAAVAFVVDMLCGTDPVGYAGCGCGHRRHGPASRARRDQGTHPGHRRGRGPGRTALAGRDDRVRHRGLPAPGHPRHLAPGSLSDTRTRHRRHPGPSRGVVG